MGEPAIPIAPSPALQAKMIATLTVQAVRRRTRAAWLLLGKTARCSVSGPRRLERHSGGARSGLSVSVGQVFLGRHNPQRDHGLLVGPHGLMAMLLQVLEKIAVVLRRVQRTSVEIYRVHYY